MGLITSVVGSTGPSGVGKTQLAAHMADILHGAGEQRADCFVQLQMNQYQVCRPSSRCRQGGAALIPD